MYLPFILYQSLIAPQADRIAVLAIAYHNIGVEQEFLKRFEQSILSYRKGIILYLLHNIYRFVSLSRFLDYFIIFIL
jgi:hypothetical protein